MVEICVFDSCYMTMLDLVNTERPTCSQLNQSHVNRK